MKKTGIATREGGLKLSANSLFILFFIVLIGATVRFWLAYNRSFFGDECGTMIHICQSPKYILTHCQPWLSMNWYILLEKAISRVFGEGFIAMRFVSIIAGTGTIALAALLCQRLFPTSSIAAAVLTAANPFLINISVRARSYALLAFFSLLFWLILLSWRKKPDWLHCIALAVTGMILVLLHFNGAFLIVWLVAVLFLDLIMLPRNSEGGMRLWQGIKRLSVPLGLCMGAAGLFWYQLLDCLKTFGSQSKIQGVSLTPFESLPTIFTMYYGFKLLALCFLIFLLIGIVYAFRNNRHKGIIIILWLAAPLLSASALGYNYGWDYRAFARFFIFTLPVMLICCAAGINRAASLLGKRICPWVTWMIVLGMCCLWIPVIEKDFQKNSQFPHHKVAAYIAENWRDGDSVLCFGFDGCLNLAPYLKCNERQRLFDKCTKGYGQYLAQLKNTPDAGRVFLVSWFFPDFPEFDSQTTMLFGTIKVSLLPSESQADRYARLLKGFEQAYNTVCQNDAGNTTCSQACYVLYHLMLFHDDHEKANFYKGLVPQEWF